MGVRFLEKIIVWAFARPSEMHCKLLRKQASSLGNPQSDLGKASSVFCGSGGPLKAVHIKNGLLGGDYFFQAFVFGPNLVFQPFVFWLKIIN